MLAQYNELSTMYQTKILNGFVKGEGKTRKLKKCKKSTRLETGTAISYYTVP